MAITRLARVLLWAAFLVPAAAGGGAAIDFTLRHVSYMVGYRDGYSEGWDKGWANGHASKPPESGQPPDWSKIDTSKLGPIRTGP